MLSFFKSNNPSVVVFYIVYIILFRVCFAFIPINSNIVFEHHEPLSNLVFRFLKNTSPDYALTSMILSGLLCFIQSLLVNGIVNDNKFLPRKSYVAGLLFIIFSSFFKETLMLSPACLGLTFLIIAAGRIFSLFKKEKPNSAIFDVGFLIAVATLFYFPSVLFILLAYIGLSTIRPFAYREWIIILIGFLCPFIIAFTFYFWNDRTVYLFQDMANLHSNNWFQMPAIGRIDWILLLSISLISVAVLVTLPAALYSSLIQVRKFSTLLVIFLLLTAISFPFQQTVSLNHFVFLGLPLGIISALVITQIKSKVVSEVIHIILILLVLSGQFLPLFNLF